MSNLLFVHRLLLFSCKKVTYVWDGEKHEFVKLCGLDHGVSSDVLHRAKPLSKNEQFMRRLVYGPNEITVKESTVMELLFLEVLNPFYIFQVCSFVLWFADNYYYYAAAILLMSAFGISMTVIQTQKVSYFFPFSLIYSSLYYLFIYLLFIHPLFISIFLIPLLFI